MSSASVLQFDHLYLTEQDRTLISRACSGGSVVYLAPLDKGLSGSSVWLAKWKLLAGNHSKLHVFKIGQKTKLDRENEAIKAIASVIEPGFPHVAYFPDDTGLALLRQEFIGDATGGAQSLRQFIENCPESAAAREMLQYLFMERMKHWHPPGDHYQRKTLTFFQALDWWWGRANLEAAANQIGRAGLERSLNKTFSMGLVDLQERVKKLAEKSSTISIGPIHGDLHAQNVIISGTNRQLELIDYGWTSQDKWRAIDFLMMECSLKAVCSPPQAALDDLLKMENLLDDNDGKPPIEYGELRDAMHGVALANIASGIHATRYCAAKLGAIADSRQYREGLILFMACLVTLPAPVNRAFLFHSIAYHLKRIEVM